MIINDNNYSEFNYFHSYEIRYHVIDDHTVYTHPVLMYIYWLLFDYLRHHTVHKDTK